MLLKLNVFVIHKKITKKEKMFKRLFLLSHTFFL
jgi:hypothetical protein